MRTAEPDRPPQQTNRGSMTKFAAVGGINTALDFAIFASLYFAAGWGLIVANTVAYSVAVANSYVLNRIWTFRDTGSARAVPVQAGLFLMFNVIGLLLANAVIWAFALYVPALYAKVGAVGATFVWNYWTSRRFVYR